MWNITHISIIKEIRVYGKYRQEKQLQNEVGGAMMGRITKWEYTSKENNLGLEGSGQSWII